MSTADHIERPPGFEAPRNLTLADLARVIELARIAYQVELPDVSGQLVDPDCIRVDVCPPGVCDLRGQTVDAWRVTIGEEDDGSLAYGEGESLDAAVTALARAVDERAARVRALLSVAMGGAS